MHARLLTVVAKAAMLDEGILGMLIQRGTLTSRILFVLTIALVSAMISMPAMAQEEASGLDILEIEEEFDAVEAPDPPFHAHQSMLHFPPGAEAPLHHHGGPGYITILQGELTLYEDGEENVYEAGDSLVETTDALYKGGNYTESDTVLMVTYLIPEGEEMTTLVDDPDAPASPEIVSETVAEAAHEFTEPTGSFDLIHRTERHDAGSVTDPENSDGVKILTVVQGELELSLEDNSQTVTQGDYALIRTDQEYSLENTGEAETLTMTTKLSPNVYGVVPDTGSAVDRTFAMWLIVLTASTLLVVGAVLRLTIVRIR
jgi:quercetin dioxygenase-like cupin family protein